MSKKSLFAQESIGHKSRVPDQNGVSLLYIMLEIHHSGQEPSKYDDRQTSFIKKKRSFRSENFLLQIKYTTGHFTGSQPDLGTQVICVDFSVLRILCLFLASCFQALVDSVIVFSEFFFFFFFFFWFSIFVEENFQVLLICSFCCFMSKQQSVPQGGSVSADSLMSLWDRNCRSQLLSHTLPVDWHHLTSPITDLISPHVWQGSHWQLSRKQTLALSNSKRMHLQESVFTSQMGSCVNTCISRVPDQNGVSQAWCRDTPFFVSLGLAIICYACFHENGHRVSLYRIYSI